MNDESLIHLIDVPIRGREGFVWNRLHGEREALCEAIIEDNGAKGNSFESRLSSVDAALDRLMSGTYGTCLDCGRMIEESSLELDPSRAICLSCWGHNRLNSYSETSPDVTFENLRPFDTVLIKTKNSDYRIFMLDPTVGRALMEGGGYLLEPSEVRLMGSGMSGAAFKRAAICVGRQLEIWVAGKILRTSSIQSIEVRKNSLTESAASIAPTWP